MTPEQRAAAIDERKQPQPSAEKQALHKIWVRDDWAYYDVWQVPIELLVLNADNKRFSSERELVEHNLQRELDPANNPSDEQSIIAILLDSSVDVDFEQGQAVGTPSKDYVALREDWLERGQEEPLWIRPDGTVRNGNRRLAMLKRLRDTGSETNWVEAIILPAHEIDEAELFRMEQREQLTENFKKRYQDVNALLALKDAAELENIDWEDPASIARVAGRLKHQAGRDDASYASKQLYAIRALDQYLAYINSPGRYSIATKQVEVFREVGLCISNYEEEPDQQFVLLQAAFAFVQAGRKYGEIRQLRKLFGDDRDLFDRMWADIQNAEESSGWDPEESEPEMVYPELSDATAPDDDAEDDDELSGVVGPADYPKSDVSDVVAGVLDQFSASQMDVRKKLDQAVTRLDDAAIEALSTLEGPARAEALIAVRKIADWAQRATEALE